MFRWNYCRMRSFEDVLVCSYRPYLIISSAVHSSWLSLAEKLRLVGSSKRSIVKPGVTWDGSCKPKPLKAHYRKLPTAGTAPSNNWDHFVLWIWKYSSRHVRWLVFLDQATASLKHTYSVLAANIKWSLPNYLILAAGGDTRFLKPYTNRS